jgi:hypothetical protein
MAEPTPIRRVIACLARIAVEDYLRPEAAPEAAQEPERPNPVPLPDMDRAA